MVPAEANTPLCDETGDQCVECFDVSDCKDDDLFCTGDVICEAGLCGFEDAPCGDDTPACDEDADQCVECMNDGHCSPDYWCLSNSCFFRGTVLVDRADIKAGTTDKTDSINISGFLDATENDFIAALGGDVVVTIEADHIPDPDVTQYTFPVDQACLNNGTYSSPKIKPEDKADPVISFSVDTSKGTMRFSAKNVDLTGVRCPVTFRVQFGNYAAEVVLNEDIVNGPKKPCPLPLMMGVYDSLDVVKLKTSKGAKPDSDSVSIAGTFTIDGSFDMNDSMVIRLGSDTFRVPGIAFPETNGIYSCKKIERDNGVVTAKFDTVKCTYSISIKNTTFSSSGDVAFALDLFGNSLQASGPVELP